MEIKDRQLEILEAAATILNEQGISGLTTKNLANKVGFTEAALYRHYSSKEEIIAALLHYLHELMQQRLMPIISQTEMPATERLRQFFGSQLDFFSAQPHFLTAVFSEGMLQYSPSVTAGILKLMSFMQTQIGEIISEGQKKGIIIQSTPPQELTHIFLGSFRLLMLKWRISDFEFEIKSRGQVLINHLISIISNKTES